MINPVGSKYVQIVATGHYSIYATIICAVKYDSDLPNHESIKLTQLQCNYHVPIGVGMP